MKNYIKLTGKINNKKTKILDNTNKFFNNNKSQESQIIYNKISKTKLSPNDIDNYKNIILKEKKTEDINISNNNRIYYLTNNYDITNSIEKPDKNILIYDGFIFKLHKRDNIYNKKNFNQLVFKCKNRQRINFAKNKENVRNLKKILEK